MKKVFLVQVEDGKVSINGDFVKAKCRTSLSIGTAVALWLDKQSEKPVTKISEAVDDHLIKAYDIVTAYERRGAI